jgi:hypothetical protein
MKMREKTNRSRKDWRLVSVLVSASVSVCWCALRYDATYVSQTSPGGRNAVTIWPSDAFIFACL